MRRLLRPSRSIAHSISPFASCGLHPEDDVVQVVASLCIDGSRLVRESFRMHRQFVVRSLRHTHGEFAARVAVGLPAKFFLSHAFDPQLYARKGQRLLREDGSLDQKIMRVAILLCTGRYPCAESVPGFAGACSCANAGVTKHANADSKNT